MQRFKIFLRCILIGLALLGSSFTPASAAIFTTGDVSPGSLGPGDTVVSEWVFVGGDFDTPGTGTLEINSGNMLTIGGPEPALGIGRVDGAQGTVTVTGTDGGSNASTLRLEGVGSAGWAPWINIGRGGVGVLNVENGGNVVIDGLGANVNSDNSAGFNIGRQTTTSGSTLNISGSDSEVRVENVDHTLVVMGREADATLNVTAGGSLIVDGNNDLISLRNGVVNVNTGGFIQTEIFNVAALEYDVTTVNLDGATSRIHLTGVGDASSDYSNAGYGGFMTVGGRDNSVAVVNVTNGAQINIDDGSGVADDGTVSAGAGFSLGGNSALGFGGDGTLNVNTGAMVTLSAGGGEFVGIGRTQNGSGTINLASGGQIIIENHVDSDGVYMANAFDAGRAEINVDGDTSLFDAGRFLGVGVDSNLTSTNKKATIMLTNNGVVRAEEIAIGSGAIVKGVGRLEGRVVQNQGTIAPGLSPGTLIIDGDFTMNGGVLEIEVAGLGAGDFDVLSITGSADLTGGSIVFSFIDDFLPETGDSFLFLEALGGLNIVDNFDFAYKGVQDTFRMAIGGGPNGLGFLALNDASAVPVPAAVWLFGTALIGFVGMSRRRKVA
jgi:hypothetical protein